METQKKQTKRSLLVKKPFTKLSALGSGGEEVPMSGGVGMKTPTRDRLMPVEITQSEMLRQLDPSSHIIYNKEYYPDIWRQDEDGRYYLEKVPRYAFAYQRIILTKQLTHLCGNDTSRATPHEKRMIRMSGQSLVTFICSSFRLPYHARVMKILLTTSIPTAINPFDIII